MYTFDCVQYGVCPSVLSTLIRKKILLCCGYLHRFIFMTVKMVVSSGCVPVIEDNYVPVETSQFTSFLQSLSYELYRPKGFHVLPL